MLLHSFVQDSHEREFYLQQKLRMHRKEDLSLFQYFPLKHKSDFTQCFVNFQSDGGGEFIDTSFRNYLVKNGIVHHKSWTHTPEQNGLAE